MGESIADKFRNWFWQPLLGDAFLTRIREAEKYRSYRQGNQRRQMRVRPGQQDDNLVINYTGLIIDRSVTMLFGKGVDFDLPGEGDTPEQEYIDAVWAANKKEILLHKLGLFGAEQGTPYVKIIPGGTMGRVGETLIPLPRLVCVDPQWVEIFTSPDDIEDVWRYRIQYIRTNDKGDEEAVRQDIERDDNVDREGQMAGEAFWWVRDYVTDKSGRWQPVDKQRWEYSFPPIHHWQNLPAPDSVYGVPDATDDVLELQDRINYVSSNISKIVRLYAHPMRYGRNLGNVSKVNSGPDEMLVFDQPEAEIVQLDQLGDLMAAGAHLQVLRQSLFDITQTVDLASMADKVGSLTNFGLRVLYNDALAKLGTKQELYGDGLAEINRRLLILGEYGDDPGGVIWPDILPMDEMGQTNALKMQVEAGFLNKRSAQLELGLDPEQETERMEEERATGDNIGAMLLRNFGQGGGVQ